jgi:polyphosphate kinase
MTQDLLDGRRTSAQPPFATAGFDASLPAFAAPIDDAAIARARALAAGLKSLLRSASQPAPVVEAAYLLDEGRNPDCPLLERIRILGLLASVLDHYFAEQAPAMADSKRVEITEQLDPLLQRAFDELNDALLPALVHEYDILIRRHHELDGLQRSDLRRFFRQKLYPMLTPLAVDPGHPFPFISSHSINLLVHLSSPDLSIGPLSYARIKVPRLMSRFVTVPSAAGQNLFIWSEDVVAGFLDELFPGMNIESVFLFRVLRASSIERNGDELEAQSRGLRNQQLTSPVVRLEYEAAMPEPVVEWLASHLPVPLQFCYRSSGPLAMFQLVDLANLAHIAN